MITDSPALSFEIPARDALGREHVEGRLVAEETSLQFYWRFRDRTFKRLGEDMRIIELAYVNVESVMLKTMLGRWKPRLLLRLTDPRPLGEVPGTQVGAATLWLGSRGGVAEAKAFIKMIDYRRSEAVANERIERMSELDGKPGGL